jgi:hypothetical protein
MVENLYVRFSVGGFQLLVEVRCFAELESSEIVQSTLSVAVGVSRSLDCKEEDGI